VHVRAWACRVCRPRQLAMEHLHRARGRAEQAGRAGGRSAHEESTSLGLRQKAASNTLRSIGMRSSLYLPAPRWPLRPALAAVMDRAGR
jgi:hypothetical protein